MAGWYLKAFDWISALSTNEIERRQPVNVHSRYSLVAAATELAVGGSPVTALLQGTVLRSPPAFVLTARTSQKEAICYGNPDDPISVPRRR